MRYIDATQSRAVEKSEHYRAALDAQLLMCDKADEVINRLSEGFPR